MRFPTNLSPLQQQLQRLALTIPMGEKGCTPEHPFRFLGRPVICLPATLNWSTAPTVVPVGQPFHRPFPVRLTTLLGLFQMFQPLKHWFESA